MTISLATPQPLHPPILAHPPLTKKVVPGWVSEAEYWEKYYADPDHHYEWNHGYLEETGVSDKLTLFSYEWFFELLRNYLRVIQAGEMVALETGSATQNDHSQTGLRRDPEKQSGPLARFGSFLSWHL